MPDAEEDGDAVRNVVEKESSLGIPVQSCQSPVNPGKAIPIIDRTSEDGG